MSFIIVGDNSSNLPVALIDHYDLKILPMGFHSGDKEYYSYLQGEDIDLASFYHMMREGEVFATSLISYGSCKEVLDPVVESSDEDMLYLGISSGISGSFNVVSNYFAEQQEKYPGRRFIAIDGLSASLGQGLLTLKAARLRDEEGKSLDEVCAWLEENITHMGHWFTVDDLMFLFRGGRLSRASAMAGTLLDVKPIMHLDDEGKLIPVAKVRNRRKSLKALVDRMEEMAARPLDTSLIAISHGDCEDDAHYVADLVCERFGITRDDIIINIIDPVIGAHSGPGTVALFFMASER